MKRLSVTHRLTSDYAKNYCNPTLVVQVILKNVVTCFFLGHSVLYAQTGVMCVSGDKFCHFDIMQHVLDRWSVLSMQHSLKTALLHVIIFLHIICYNLVTLIFSLFSISLCNMEISVILQNPAELSKVWSCSKKQLV